MSLLFAFVITLLHGGGQFISIYIRFFFFQDESVRLWNVQTGICILIFAGAGGHRNEVLSVVSTMDNFASSHLTMIYYWK